jgi:hypothetical protein
VAALTAGAFVLYGGWAMFANGAHGVAIASRAFVVQGASSGVSTLALSAMIEWFLARSRGGAGRLLAVLVPPTITGSMHVAGHALNATPNLWVTTSVPLAMGYIFAAAYVWSRRQVRSSRGA